MKLKSAQKKGLSEFFNSVSVAWFAAGVISPLFLQSFVMKRFAFSSIFAMGFTVVFLTISMQLLRRLK